MPELLIEQSAFEEWSTAHQVLPLTCKNAGILTAFLKGAVTWSCDNFNSVQAKQKSNACTQTIIQTDGFWNSCFPWFLTIFSDWAHCITHNMLCCCRIMIGNWFWKWTRSLFTQVNCCNSSIWCCGGLFEGVQVRQSLKDPSNITFTTSVFF